MQKIDYIEVGETIYHQKLNNGLNVYLIPKKDYAKTFGMIGCKYGSIDNCFIPYGEKEYIHVPNGIAHFLEHKLFEMPDGIDASMRLSQLGARSNAYTTYDRTCYLFSTTSNVGECINVLLDFVFEPYFTEENVKKERGIIEQEINMYLDDSDFKAMSGLMLNMYSKNSVREEIVGSVESISKIDEELLNLCYKTFYQPSNMQLFLIGNFDLSIIEDIEKNQDAKTFLPPQEIKRKYALEDEVVKEEDSEEMEISIPHLVLGIKMPLKKRNQLEQVKSEMLVPIILTCLFSDSSDNYNKLVKQKLINDSFGNYGSQDNYASYIMFYGDSIEPKKLSTELLKMIKNIPFETISKETFKRVKNCMIGTFISSLNSFESIAGNCIRYNFFNLDFFNTIPVLENITYEEAMDFLNEFKNIETTTFTVYPKKAKK